MLVVLIEFQFDPLWVVVRSGMARLEEFKKFKPFTPRIQITLPKRSESATIFISELKEKILKTGVVKNTHEDYNSKSNKRFKVSERQAARVAYSIAKKEGFRVGKFRGPNKK